MAKEGGGWCWLVFAGDDYRDKQLDGTSRRNSTALELMRNEMKWLPGTRHLGEYLGTWVPWYRLLLRAPSCAVPRMGMWPAGKGPLHSTFYISPPHLPLSPLLLLSPGPGNSVWPIRPFGSVRISGHRRRLPLTGFSFLQVQLLVLFLALSP